MGEFGVKVERKQTKQSLTEFSEKLNTFSQSSEANHPKSVRDLTKLQTPKLEPLVFSKSS